MSFVCQITGKISKMGDPRTGPLYYIDSEKSLEDIHAPEKMNKIVVATREKVYTRWFKNEETGKWEELEVGRGWEIVREINASEEGLQLWNSWSEDERAIFLENLDN